MNTEEFPEISKAVGAHKYIKRVLKVGGGYRYIYEQPKGEERHNIPTKVDAILGELKSAIKAGDTSKARLLADSARSVAITGKQESKERIAARAKAGQITKKDASILAIHLERNTQKALRKVDVAEKAIARAEGRERAGMTRIKLHRMGSREKMVERARRMGAKI